MPVHLHGDPLPALPVSLSLLGGLLSVLCVSAAHHVQDEPQGALLSTSAVPLRLTATSEGEDAEASPPVTSPRVRGGRA